MSAYPPHPKGDEPSIRLPPGALPPPREPKLTLRQWWYVNRWVIIAPIVIVAVIAGYWAAETVPALHITQDERATVVPYLVPRTVDDYSASYIITTNHGGSASGTYWSPDGDVVLFQADGTSNYYSNYSSNGTFHISLVGPDGWGILLFSATTPATIYVNYTVSYVVPLIHS